MSTSYFVGTIPKSASTIKLSKAEQIKMKPKPSKCDKYAHKYEHEDIHIQTEISYHENQIKVKHSYWWLDEKQKLRKKIHLQVFKK
jgi:hypothetical protein